MGQNDQSRAKMDGLTIEYYKGPILINFAGLSVPSIPCPCLTPKSCDTSDPRRVLRMRMKGCREQWRQMRQPGVEETAKSPSLVRACGLGMGISSENFRFWIDPKRHTQVLVMSKPS